MHPGPPSVKDEEMESWGSCLAADYFQSWKRRNLAFVGLECTVVPVLLNSTSVSVSFSFLIASKYWCPLNPSNEFGYLWSYHSHFLCHFFVFDACSQIWEGEITYNGNPSFSNPKTWQKLETPYRIKRDSKKPFVWVVKVAKFTEMIK